MTNRERLDAVAIALVAVTIAMVGSKLARALSLPSFSRFGGDTFTWWFRLRVFDIRNEVLALGAVAYVMPRTRVTAAGLRLAAALGVVGVAAQVALWLIEQTSDISVAGIATVPDAVLHVAAIGAFGAVIAMWFFAEHRDASPEVAAPDLS